MCWEPGATLLPSAPWRRIQTRFTCVLPLLTRVLLGRGFVAVLEELDGGIPAYAELLRQLRLLRGVHLGQPDFRALGLQLRRRLRILGRQRFAVPAPRGVCGMGRQRRPGLPDSTPGRTDALDRKSVV